MPERFRLPPVAVNETPLPITSLLKVSAPSVVPMVTLLFDAMRPEMLADVAVTPAAPFASMMPLLPSTPLFSVSAPPDDSRPLWVSAADTLTVIAPSE